MNETNSFRLRLFFLAAFMLAGFLILAGKLWHEQIRYGERYRQSISRQSVRRVRLPGLRGKILSSDYLILADNAPSYNLVFYLQEMRRTSRKRTVENIRKTAQSMSAMLHRPDTLTEERILRHIKIQPGVPLVIYRNLSDVELSAAFQAMPQLPGLGIEIEPVRRYPYGQLASGVIGYVRPDDPMRATDRKEFYYYFSDLSGKTGMERACETFAGDKLTRGLHSQAGYELIQVDHLGFVSARHLLREEPINGNNMVLTIDSRAQKLGEKLMEESTGALVLLDADTGAVLALVSSPGFDLTQTTPVWDAEQYKKLLHDPERPLFARAFQGSYTPGSIVKPLVALAAIKNGVDPFDEINCDGRTQIGNAKISCARRSGHGSLNMIGALARSCNDFFIETGMRLGLEKLAEMYHAAGIGQPTGLELDESVGLLPSRDVKVRRQRMAWNNYDTALISIGQGMILLSPVQAARYAAAIANGGRLPKLYLLKEVTDDTGKVLFHRNPELAEPWKLPAGALATVRQGMFDVVNAESGGGKNAHSDLLTIYGKTGTAEVDTRTGRIKNTWFISFCEYEGRRYAMAILVEQGRSGGSNCAPLAKKMYEEYLIKGAL